MLARINTIEWLQQVSKLHGIGIDIESLCFGIDIESLCFGIDMAFAPSIGQVLPSTIRQEVM